MNVLLVNPPTLYRWKSIEAIDVTDVMKPVLSYYKQLLLMEGSKRGDFTTISGEHLGLQSLQASLEQVGHHVVVLNSCTQLHSTLPQTFNEIQRHCFDLLGFTGPADVFGEILWLARKVREAGYTGHITYGHHFASLNAQTLLRRYSEFDSIVRGEGEITLTKLANALENNLPLQTVQGITFRSQNQIVVNPAEPVVDLDRLPWVTRYDLKSVLKIKMSAGIYTSRGCPYQCSFCTTGRISVLENYSGIDRWRRRAAYRVIDEIAYLQKKYKLDWITIVDDSFIVKGEAGADHALNIAAEIIRRNLKINYMVDCRVDAIDKKIFRELAKSGLRKVFVGVESLSAETLKNMRKGYKPEIIAKNLQILKDLGIKFHLGYIFFNPLQTLNDLEEEHRRFSRLPNRDFSLFFKAIRSYPGTDLHSKLEQMELLAGNFPCKSVKYIDSSVGQIRQVLSQFAEKAFCLTADHVHIIQTPEIQDKIYFLIRDYLGELIAIAKKNESDEIKKCARDMWEQFSKLVEN